MSVNQFKYRLIAVCGVLLTTGCASEQLGSTMNSWQGSHIDEVAAAWGAPDECATNDGRRICKWHDQAAGFSLSTASSCVRSLEIDPDGIVVGWRWRGDYCFASSDRVLARSQTDRPEALDSADRGTDSVGVAVTQPAE
ncbi:MAG: hypothetical protein ACR2QV_08820 [Gammaproteobacteria bacterium]